MRCGWRRVYDLIVNYVILVFFFHLCLLDRLPLPPSRHPVVFVVPLFTSFLSSPLCSLNWGKVVRRDGEQICVKDSSCVYQKYVALEFLTHHCDQSSPPPPLPLLVLILLVVTSPLRSAAAAAASHCHSSFF